MAREKKTEATRTSIQALQRQRDGEFHAGGREIFLDGLAEIIPKVVRPIHDASRRWPNAKVASKSGAGVPGGDVSRSLRVWYGRCSLTQTDHVRTIRETATPETSIADWLQLIRGARGFLRRTRAGAYVRADSSR